MKAVIGIGTNIGDRLENIKSAEKAINLLPNTKIINTSNIYETKPWGYLDQQDFLNSVVLIETSLSPQALLGACLGIEAGFGRIRSFKNGPRIVDLDLLFYDNLQLNSDELTLPHPGICERAFVLVPLADIFTEKSAFGIDFSNCYSSTDLNSVKIYNE